MRCALAVRALHVVLALLGGLAGCPAEAQWRPERGLVLVGTAVTMNDAGEVIPEGRVFIRDGKIEAVVRSGEALPPAAADAITLETGEAFIYPGLVDLHNHPEYNVFPLWIVPERYVDRYQWRGRRAYKAAVAEPYKVLSAREYLNLQAELGKYAELKALIGGTTAIQGMARHKAYSSVEYLVRNVESTDVGAKPVRRMLDPARNEDGWREARKAATTSGAWLFHLAEGRGGKAAGEFALLKSKGLLLGQLVGIHSVAVTADQFHELGSAGAKMVWSPLSNYLLYGETAGVRAAKSARVLISLAPDWSPSGSKAILGELKVADLLNRTKLGRLFSDRELVQMVTRNPAMTLGWGAIAGQLGAGFLGDIIVVARVDNDPYRNLIVATETHVQLSVVRGEPLYGDEPLMRQLKTYRQPTNGGTKLVRQYEILKSGLSGGPPRKAVDFKRAGVEKGDLSVNDLMETLSTALRFDRERLFALIPKAQVVADLKKCQNAPAPADPPTQADFERFLKCTFPGGLPPTPLDPPFTTTDDEFFRRLEANQNLPPELKRLKDYYRSP